MKKLCICALFFFLPAYCALEGTMLIAVGTTNRAKVEAVQELILDYPNLASAEIVSVPVSSEISDQPLTLAETIQGAKNRARNAFTECGNCQYGIGIESGLIEAPGTQTGYMNISACCIYDGTDSFIGLSTAFEIPPHVLEYVLKEKCNLSQACLRSGISQNSHIGSEEGLIGILTDGRVDRKKYTKECLATALIQVENAALYGSLR